MASVVVAVAASTPSELGLGLVVLDYYFAVLGSWPEHAAAIAVGSGFVDSGTADSVAVVRSKVDLG